MNRKKLAFGLGLMTSLMMLGGCGNTQVSNEEVAANEEAELNVVTTVFAPYDFAKEVVGEYGEVTMLVPPAAESHSYEPTPQDIIKIQECDVFVYAGGESDEWVTDILESVGNDEMKVIKMLDLVDAVEEEIIEGMQADGHHHDHSHEHEEGENHEHEEGEYHEENTHEEVTHNAEGNEAVSEEEHHEEEEHGEKIEYDEHVWTSPKNAIEIVKGIEEAVSAVDGEHSEAFAQNTTSYIAELEALDQQFEEVVANGNRKEIIFADRFPLRYFVEAYGLDYYAAFPGCSTDTEPSAATVAFLIDKIKEDEIPVVFHIELSNEKMADTIAEATGAKKLLFNACHTVSKEDFESGVTYIDIMQDNVNTLKEALE